MPHEISTYKRNCSDMKSFGRRKNVKEKITLKIENLESFFKRARKIARRADHGKPIRKQITFSFEDVESLDYFLSSKEAKRYDWRLRA